VLWRDDRVLSPNRTPCARSGCALAAIEVPITIASSGRILELHQNVPTISNSSRRTSTATCSHERTALSSDNVAQLGVDWQANTGAKAYTSPAVVYRPNLGKTLVYVGRGGAVASHRSITTGCLVVIQSRPHVGTAHPGRPTFSPIVTKRS